MLTPPANTRAPREAHRLDEVKLGAWLSANISGAVGTGSKATVLQFKGGQSNPTYWVNLNDEIALVLRKKPPGKLLPSAHAVEREYKVMRALKDTDVPVPDAMALCEDDSVIGTPFFVMRFRPNRIFWDPTLPELSIDDRRALYADYVRVLAALHKVDYAKVGLADFGKVGGFVARQVDRWSKQYQASRTAEIPAMEALMTWLSANIPTTDETSLIHGDYRLDNILFTPEGSPKAIGVIDWELSTLGHPLSDLSYACMAYHLNLPGRGGLAGVDVGALGIPTEDETIVEYLRLTNRDSVKDTWPFFMAFGIFRLAAIAQGVYARSLQGNASSDDASSYGAAVNMLADLACGIAKIKVS